MVSKANSSRTYATPNFLSRRRQLKLVSQADQKILTKLTTEGEEIKQQKTQVEEKKMKLL